MHRNHSLSTLRTRRSAWADRNRCLRKRFELRYSPRGDEHCVAPLRCRRLLLRHDQSSGLRASRLAAHLSSERVLSSSTRQSRQFHHGGPRRNTLRDWLRQHPRLGRNHCKGSLTAHSSFWRSCCLGGAANVSSLFGVASMGFTFFPLTRIFRATPTVTFRIV